MSEQTAREAIDGLLEQRRVILSKIAALEAEDQELEITLRVVERYRGPPKDQKPDETRGQ